MDSYYLQSWTYSSNIERVLLFSKQRLLSCNVQLRTPNCFPVLQCAYFLIRLVRRMNRGACVLAESKYKLEIKALSRPPITPRTFHPITSTPTNHLSRRRRTLLPCGSFTKSQPQPRRGACYRNTNITRIRDQTNRSRGTWHHTATAPS